MKHEGDSTGTDFAIFMDAYDWQSAMLYADFKFEDIQKIEYTREGFNDGDHWHLIVLLKNGKYAALNAWCDYSGWDCQAGGSSQEFDSIDQAHEWLIKED